MTEKHRIESVQRAARVLMMLAGHEIDGLAPGQIALGAKISPSQATRTLANLQIAGLAEQISEGGRWRLAPRIVQIAIAHMHAIDKAQSKLGEIQNRFSRQPK